MADDKKKKLGVDKLEERVAPAMLGGIVGDGIDGGEPIDEPIDEGATDDGLTNDLADDGTGVDDGLEEGIEEPTGEPAGEPAPDAYGDGATMDGETGQVTFDAPEGHEFDEYGTLDIPAEEAGESFAPYPPGTSIDGDGVITVDGEAWEGEPLPGFFPPGSSIAADGSFHFESTEPYELNEDGSMTTVDPTFQPPEEGLVEPEGEEAPVGPDAEGEPVEEAKAEEEPAVDDGEKVEEPAVDDGEVIDEKVEEQPVDDGEKVEEMPVDDGEVIDEGK